MTGRWWHSHYRNTRLRIVHEVQINSTWSIMPSEVTTWMAAGFNQWWRSRYKIWLLFMHETTHSRLTQIDIPISHLFFFFLRGYAWSFWGDHDFEACWRNIRKRDLDSRWVHTNHNRQHLYIHDLWLSKSCNVCISSRNKTFGEEKWNISI